MAIIFNGVSHVYGEGSPFRRVAINNINLHIKKGEFVGIIGHTGSGKSTLIQHFNGLLKATEGEIIILGKNLNDKDVSLKEIRQKVGLVFQYPEHQLFETTIFKDVAFGPENMGLPKEEVNKRVIKALDMVGLGEDMYEKSPFDLSGGQKRRVAIAGVLAMKPEVLILDEPTAGLDPRGRDEILGQIQKLHKSLGITVILVSHSMEDIAKLVDRIIVMYKSRIALDGAPDKVFKNVKELEKMGLAAPQIMYIMKALRKKGIEVPTDVLTVEEGAKKIASLLKSQK
ncbi:MAG TPA: energy-coupling factor transporter ATPase [Defluviitaleaceae bacterium]|jgi:energy-coupling factor transport system ATP-binding protein|nr:energy-coupling factor transporter ATPase [Candidatus Epulonipiscium sp.]HOA80178.1 energy-coupling factor transporter ATPase [Defluviitaleaceae bacterium]